MALVEEALAARALLPPGATLFQAVERLAAEVGRQTPVLPPTATLVDKLVDSLQKHPHRPRSEKRVSEVRSRLTRFAKKFPNLLVPERPNVEAYLLELGGAAKTHDNHLGAIAQLYHFAQRHGWPKTRELPTEGLVKYYEPGAPATFTPVVMRQVMAKVEPEWVPFFALGAFAGLRPTEIFRMRWEHFRWAEKVIAVPAVVAAKVRRPRLVPIAANLEKWLCPWSGQLGVLYPGISLKAIQNRQGSHLMRLQKLVRGLIWEEDVLRHSYGSYRLAQTQSLAQVVLEMGTSESMLKRHYNDPKTEAEAREWFSIEPDDARKVVPITDQGSLSSAAVV